MPEIRRNGGRKSSACRRCHKQKVKCTRDNPCRNCRTAHVDCVYPEREKLVMVPESYLKTLEASHDGREPSDGCSRPDSVPSQHAVENSAAEVFVARVKQLRQHTSFSVALDPPPVGDSESNNPPTYPVGHAHSHEYFPLAYDTSQPLLSIHLPPFPYAIHLLEQVDIYMGHDYHWFRWQNFKDRMECTYKNPCSAEVKDRLWLCQLLIVFALGETFVSYRAPEIRLGTCPPRTNGQEDANRSPSPPGATFFEHALVLLKLPFEEPTLAYIEALNLATFYSYSLNRKKTAYTYAGMSARVCNLLRLDQVSPHLSCAISEREHRKRVCWTSYCLDKMTSSELGLVSSFRPGQIELEYPTNDVIPVEDAVQFHEAEFFHARIQLTLIKAEADVFIDMWHSIQDDIPDIERQVIPIMTRLQSLISNLPAHMSFDCESGMPEDMTRMPTMRSLASLYLRCHHCFILLLRPLFLKHIAHILSDDIFSIPQENLQTFSNRCVLAARTNLCILIGLWDRERIAKFGFWDSLHLFSSLTILSLAMTTNRQRLGIFEKDTDFVTYSTAKNLLYDMVRAGSLASKEHAKMLSDVEALGEALEAIQTQGMDPPTEQWDMDHWIEQVLNLDPTSVSYNSLE
ncbi:hypothetical protein FE257_006248 [Aspergillus nanangensis]|uniref:Zn(2)-C6 fungal-type domain-containing protein n=1 Tax=Aspergillus nanangensis TaxID=2582783 RepID=A0AAD4CQW1_ASPNN|nr:hypothetical protein FE257_006248 [Aspergillus nanangensis]